MASQTNTPLQAPDGRYIIVRGRLWRKTNPRIREETRTRLVAELMAARRAVKEAGDDDVRLRAVRKAIDAAKIALGERGPVWWDDGTPDLNRHMAKTTSYAAWHRRMTGGRQ